MCCVTNDAVTAEVDETQSHMQPVVEKQEPDDVCCIIYAVFKHTQFPQILANRSCFWNCFTYFLTEVSSIYTKQVSVLI